MIFLDKRYLDSSFKLIVGQGRTQPWNQPWIRLETTAVSVCVNFSNGLNSLRLLFYSPVERQDSFTKHHIPFPMQFRHIAI